MPRMLLARAALAAALATGLSAGAAPAQAQVPYPRVPPQATELPPGVPPVDSSPSKAPFRDYREKGRPVGCWGSFNGYGCSSLYSELGFIFGGCRMFFGEPCLKGAPPSALPPWAGPVSGYGPNSTWAHRNGYGITGQPGNGNGGPNGNGAQAQEVTEAKPKRRFFGLFRSKCGCSEQGPNMP